jgi:uncharacterized damage-inducible protein DinB
MNYWMDHELKALDGPEPPYPVHAAESWPADSTPASVAAWEAEVDRFRQGIARLQAWVAKLGTGEAGRIVHERRGETVADVLWQMVAHNSYHIGQVTLLRRAFGAWPPAGGGDTW